MNLLEAENEEETGNKKKLPYSNLLIDHILTHDIKYRLAIEEIYDRLEA